MNSTRIIVYGTNWCGDCYNARKFLKKHKIEFEWINIDMDIDGERSVLDINNGMRSVPTIIFEDGSILVEPSSRELAEKLGL